MGTPRERLRELVDALPDNQLEAAICFLAEMGAEEVIDDATAARLDAARSEPGEDVPLEEVRRRLGL